MKRLLATMLALVAAVSLAGSAHADFIQNPRWVLDDVRWINTQVPSLADSDYICGSAARLDTTVALITDKWLDGIAPSPRAGTAVDSTDWAVFYLIPINSTRSGVTVSADSIYLQTQVSMDGETWALTTPTISFQVANTVRPYGTGGFVLEASSTNSFARAYKINWAATGQHTTALVGTAPTDNQLWGWRYVRFIVGQANGGCYKALLGHWTLRN